MELDVDGERTEVPELVGHPAAALVLVNDDDLTYAKLRLDERSLATLRSSIGTLPDSLARALCWSAAWDMTRDAELPAREWVQLVLAGIDAETEISVVQSLLARVQTALSSYADPRWADVGWRALADKALAALESAAPGSDEQLQWSRTLAAAARTEEHAAVLRGLLDGTREIEGLEVDADARWAFLNGLVAIGAAGDAEIDAEAARDATATGARRAATARALRPTAESKEETWRKAFTDASIPNAVHEAMLAGFWHPAQRELTAGLRRALLHRHPAAVGEPPRRDREERGAVPVPAGRRAAHGAGGRRVAGRARPPGVAAPAGGRGPGRHRPLAAGPGAGRRRVAVTALPRGALNARGPEPHRVLGLWRVRARGGLSGCAGPAGGRPGRDSWRRPLTMPPTRSPEANEFVIDRTARAQARSGSRRAAACPVTTSTTRCPGETASSTASEGSPPGGPVQLLGAGAGARRRGRRCRA